MRQPAPVADYLGADYLDTLTRALSFDVPLAERVRQEVEDHLCEAAAALGGGSGDGLGEAQRRAIRNFGDADEIASQYAASSLLRQVRRSGAIIVVASGALYLAMKGRIAWYGLMHWALSDQLRPLSKIVIQIDVCAYVLAFVLGAIGWAYISSRRVAPRFHAGCRAQLRRGLLFAVAATGAMLVSVVADGFAAIFRILQEQPPVAVFAIPLLSIGVEVGFAAVLVTALGKALRNTRRASSRLPS